MKQWPVLIHSARALKFSCFIFIVSNKISNNIQIKADWRKVLKKSKFFLMYFNFKLLVGLQGTSLAMRLTMQLLRRCTRFVSREK